MNNHIPTFEEFINESTEPISEAINHKSDKYALVSIGGPIKYKKDLIVFVGGRIGVIMETNDDNEMLKEKAKRLRKQLSTGEKEYYGMNYRVIELTSRKLNVIENLNRKLKDSENDNEEE